jgi:hypothetical protein
VPLKKAKEGKMRDKYSIRESEGDKIVQKNKETDEDGKTAEREENTKSCSEGVASKKIEKKRGNESTTQREDRE